jgi:hypothetical protein
VPYPQMVGAHGRLVSWMRTAPVLPIYNVKSLSLDRLPEYGPIPTLNNRILWITVFASRVSDFEGLGNYGHDAVVGLALEREDANGTVYSSACKWSSPVDAQFLYAAPSHLVY